jgi:hypothetical protein
MVSGIMAVLLLLVGAGMEVVGKGDTFRSVEFGLAELSPLGKAGGYAVPASGASVSPLTVSYVCNNDGTRITLSVSYTYDARRSMPSFTLSINNTQYSFAGYTTVTNGNNKVSTKTFDFPASGTYNVVVSGYTGSGSKDDPIQSFSYSASTGPISCEDHTNDPAVDLEVNNDAVGPEWVDGPININPTDDLDLRWQSDNVTSCSGNNFTVPGNVVNGTQVYITNPPSGTSRTYTIVCTGPNGSANDSVVVNATGSGAGGPPSLTGIPVYVIRGDDADLDWDTNGSDPASCVLTGPNVSVSPLSAATGTYTVTIYGESTYTLQCPGGTDTTTIRVLPELQET